MLGLWNPLKHPRGRDGKFIEISGSVRIFDAGGSQVHGEGVVKAITDKGVEVQLTRDDLHPEHVGHLAILSPQQLASVPKGEVRLPASTMVHDRHGNEVRPGAIVRTSSGQLPTVKSVDHNTGNVLVEHPNGKRTVLPPNRVVNEYPTARASQARQPSETFGGKKYGESPAVHPPDGFRAEGTSFKNDQGYRITPEKPGWMAFAPNGTHIGTYRNPAAAAEGIQRRQQDRNSGIAAPRVPHTELLSALERQGFKSATRATARSGGLKDQIPDKIKNDPAYDALKNKARSASDSGRGSAQVLADWRTVQKALANGVDHSSRPKPLLPAPPRAHGEPLDERKIWNIENSINSHVRAVQDLTSPGAKDFRNAGLSLRDARRANARGEDPKPFLDRAESVLGRAAKAGHPAAGDRLGELRGVRGKHAKRD